MAFSTDKRVAFMSEFEGIAIGTLRELGEPDPPISAFGIAELLGLDLVSESRITGARLIGSSIYLNPRAGLERQHWLVAHEIGHLLLRRAGELQSERGADAIASALLLPRREFSRDVRATEWNLRDLKKMHCFCAIETIAHRICDVREACASVWTHGRVRSRFCSLGTESRLRRITGPECELAERAAQSLAVERADFLGVAVPVICHKTRAIGVVTVVDAEQLSARIDNAQTRSA